VGGENATPIARTANSSPKPRPAPATTPSPPPPSEPPRPCSARPPSPRPNRLSSAFRASKTASPPLQAKKRARGRKRATRDLRKSRIKPSMLKGYGPRMSQKGPARGTPEPQSAETPMPPFGIPTDFWRSTGILLPPPGRPAMGQRRAEKSAREVRARRRGGTAESRR
jgi:hypothetical protein